MNIKYNYHVAGYVPILDLIVSRIILLKIWLADWAEMEKTKLPTQTTNTSLGQEQVTSTQQQGSIIEKFTDMDASTGFYPERYQDFESFFTAELKNIPRLNIFVPRIYSTNMTPNMDIVFTNFKKPEWVIQMAKFYNDTPVDPQKVDEYVSELKGDLPQEREDNTSNISSAGEIGTLNTFTWTIELRERISKLNLTKLNINLVPDFEPASEKAPMFNEMTLGLLKFISSYYPTLTMLYIGADDTDTQVLLGLSKDDVFSIDDIVKPTLVTEVRREGAWNLSTVLGYPEPNGITYTTNLVFVTAPRVTRLTSTQQGMRPRIPHDMKLLDSQTRAIHKLARRAILQNAEFGTDIPNELIYDDGIESVTDNIYTYYFSILKAPITNPNAELTAKDFDNITRDKIFVMLKPHMEPIYPDLAKLEELAIQQKITLDDAISTGAPEPDRKRLEMIYKKTQSKIKYLEYRMPYVIYLPIYDFQYIKIVPKRRAGDIFIPPVNMNITN